MKQIFKFLVFFTCNFQHLLISAQSVEIIPMENIQKFLNMNEVILPSLMIKINDGLAIVDRGDSAYISIFDLKGKLIQKFGKKGAGEMEYKSISAISFTNDSLFVLDNFNKKIDLYINKYSTFKFHNTFILSKVDNRSFIRNITYDNGNLIISGIRNSKYMISKKSIQSFGKDDEWYEFMEIPNLQSDLFTQEQHKKMHYKSSYRNNHFLAMFYSDNIYHYNEITDKNSLFYTSENKEELSITDGRVRVNNKTRTSFIDLRIENNHLFALYDGNLNIGNDFSGSGQYIYIFNINGELVKILKYDKLHIHSIEIINNTIYLLTFDQNEAYSIFYHNFNY